MLRPLPRVVLFLVALVLGLPAIAPAARADAAKLAKKSNFPGIDDPAVTLEEMLQFMGQKHVLTFELDKKAFEAQGVTEVARSRVAEKPLPKMQEASVGTVLQVVLNRLPAPNGVTYLIQRDRVVIAPLNPQVIQALQTEGRASPLRAALARRITLDNRFAENATVQDVMELLQKDHRLPVALHPSVAAMPVKLPRQANVTVEGLLTQVGKQTGCYLFLRQDHLLVLPGNSGEPPAM